MIYWVSGRYWVVLWKSLFNAHESRPFLFFMRQSVKVIWLLTSVLKFEFAYAGFGFFYRLRLRILLRYIDLRSIKKSALKYLIGLQTLITGHALPIIRNIRLTNSLMNMVIFVRPIKTRSIITFAPWALTRGLLDFLSNFGLNGTNGCHGLPQVHFLFFILGLVVRMLLLWLDLAIPPFLLVIFHFIW